MLDADLRDAADSGRFAVWWLMTLVRATSASSSPPTWCASTCSSRSSSLAAYGLVVHDNTPAARRAAAVYVALAVLGEALLLMGFVLLAAASPNGQPAHPRCGRRTANFAVARSGVGVPSPGLRPEDRARAAARLDAARPIRPHRSPAAAVLSGAAVKAGVIGLIRFLPFETASPGWGEALAAVGRALGFYGVAIGVTQSNPRTVLAYSSVSQMGLLAAVLGMGLATGQRRCRERGGLLCHASYTGQRRTVSRGGPGRTGQTRRRSMAGAAAGRCARPGPWPGFR